MKKRGILSILICLYVAVLFLTLILGVVLFKTFDGNHESASSQGTETEEVPRDTTEAETLSREQAMALYMDCKKTHKPTEQDFDQIQKGMTVQDIVAILGKPHDFHGISNFAYVMVWESVGGETLTVCIGSGGGPLDIETVMEGDYTVGEPMRESES